MRKILLFTMLLISGFSFSQDTLWLMNGRKLAVKNLKIDTTGYAPLALFQNNKGKDKGLYTYEIFSLESEGKQEQVFYKANENVEQIAVEQMRSFVSGEQSAWLNYNSRFAKISGFCIGALAPFLTDLRIAPIIPISYGLILGRTIPNTPKFIKENLSEKDSYYLLGFSEILRKKRREGALIFGGIGFSLSLAGILIASELSK